MRLEEARDAKQALAKDLGLYTPRRRVEPGLQRDMLEDYVFKPLERPSVALGVSYIDGEFVPAVRVQDRELWSEGFRARMREIVGAEADILNARRAEWAMYAFDTKERAQIGRRSREWTAVGQTEVEVVREMARCLAEIGVGRVPK